MPVVDHDSLTTFLQQQASNRLEKKEARCIKTLHTIKSQLEHQSKPPSNEALHKLQCARACYSKTLKESEIARQQWMAGQQLISEWIHQCVSLNIQMIFELNACLSGVKYECVLRTKPVYTGNNHHADPEDLELMLQNMFDFILRQKAFEHPIQKAARFRQWLLTIHPFCSSNGRTSQLVGDFILVQSGFLPQSFSSPLDILLVGTPTSRSFMTPHLAFLKFVGAVINSYQILKEQR